MDLGGELSALADRGAAWAQHDWFAAAAVAVAFVLFAALLAVSAAYLKLRREKTRASASLHRAIIASRAARARAGALRIDVQAAPAARRQTGAATEYRHVKIYIDHSNLREHWKQANPKQPDIDWDRLPPKILTALAALPDFAKHVLVYCGANVYGSYYRENYYDFILRMQRGPEPPIVPFQPETKANIKARLLKEIPASAEGRDDLVEARLNEEMAARIEGWRADNRRQKALLVDEVGRKFGYVVFAIQRQTPFNMYDADYTSSGVPVAKEKQVDTQLCADLIADAAFNVYDVAVLVANDGDFIPAVAVVRDELRKPVIHVGLATALRARCSASIELAVIASAP